MKLSFTACAWDDYQWFQDHHRKLLKRINQLIKDVLCCARLLKVLGSQNRLKLNYPVTGHAGSMMSIAWCMQPPQRK